MDGILKDRNKSRLSKHIHNCELQFCMCGNCETNEYREDYKEVLKIKKFKNCFHGLQFKQCKSCQMVYFLLIQKKNKNLKMIFKDLNKIIFSHLNQPISEIYCCRCQDNFKILTAEQLDDESWEPDHIMAYGCDSHVSFSSASYVSESLYKYYKIIKNDDVLIESGDGSKYGTDGYMITAGFFVKNNKRLTIEETKSIYELKENASVCDNCIKEMLENGEIAEGGGINEKYRRN